MGFVKPDNEKEFNCRQCGNFLNVEDLRNGKCPNCDTDEAIFINDLNDED